MNKQNTSFQEKRAETRFPVNSVAKMTILKNDKVIMGECRNISGSGMLISTDKTISPDTNIKIEIAEGKIEFNAEATVVRVVLDDDETLIAVRITKQY